MKKLSSFFLFIFFLAGSTARGQKIIAQKIFNKKIQHSIFNEVKLFDIHNNKSNISDHFAGVVKSSTSLDFLHDEASKIISEAPENILFSIPLTLNSSIEVELTRSNILTPDFNVITGSNEKMPFSYKEGLHYWGIIKGDNTSICAISIFENEVMGIISSPSLGNLVLGKIKGDNDFLHIIYNEKDLIIKPPLSCFTEFDSGKYNPDELNFPAHLSTNCIRLYWEVNYDIFQDKGSLINTTNYILGLFNESAILYANDGIPVELSQLYIWDIPSPYTATSTSSLLNQFQGYRNSFTGDLGSLLGYEGGGGVAASVNGLCASNLDYSQCYSGVSGNYQNVPTYSWSVEVITHEQGHLMGSRHTHACVWNGNNTAIDGCGPSAGYPYEGNCSGAPVPSGGGTIMSYCHLTGVGINFSLGFGSQPAAVILNNYNNVTCLSACVGGNFCGAASGMTNTNVNTNTATLNWTGVGGAVSYHIQYRVVGTTSWTLDSTNGTSYNASGLIPGTTYEWQVQTVCSNNTASYTSSTYFITVPLVCNIPTGINTLNISSLSALFIWSAAQAAIGYNIQYRLVGTSIWSSSTTTDTSYHLSGLTPSSNYEWQVQTICAGNGTSTFSGTNSFTTLAAGAPVTIVLQPDAECGKDALIGSNVPTGTNIANYGNSYEFNALAWTAGGTSSNHRSLIQFDLSFIPPGSGVISARLSLYYNPTSINPGHSTMSGPNNALLSKITSPWSESTVTWVNKPGISTVHQVTLPASTSINQDYLNIDIKDLVQDFIDSPTTNYGMMLQEQTESAYRSLVFASSDNPDATLHPKLELTYAPDITQCQSYQYSNCHGVDALIGDCIAAGYDTSNFGSTPEFDALAWTYNGGTTDFRSLIYWDFSAIPSNAFVTSADLTLYWNPSSSNTGHSTQTGSNNAYFKKITSPWSENTVTWNTQPSIDTLHQVYIPASTSTQQDFTIDVKSLVQDMVSNPSMNYGMMMKLIDETYFRSLIFCSSDHPDPARHPRIDVCYSLPNVIPSINHEIGISIIQDFASEIVIVKSVNEFEPGTYFLIYNVEGKLVRKFDQLKGNNFSFHSSGLAGGVYFYQVIGINTIQSGKIIFR